VTQLETPCREYMGARSAGGYGVVRRGGKAVNLHRYIWILANGPIPEGMCVCHRCDNPPCFRLDHLFLGTRAENTGDMMAKGRHGAGGPEFQRAKTHCPQGHPYDEENTGPRKGGGRACRACARERMRRGKES
jgi:HNH endonuclease